MKKIKADGLKEVANEVIGLEYNKIFATIKYLTTTPGQVVSEFSNGEKQKYLSPVVYFLGIGAIRIYLGSVTGVSDYVAKRNVENVARWMNSISPSHAAPKNEMDRLIQDSNSFFTFFNTEIGREVIGLPILLLLTWLFYKRFNKSFKENSWFALYTWGHASLLSIPVFLTFYITKDVTLFAPLTILISILYCTWASTKFYQLKLGKASILRVLMQLAYFLSISITLNIFSKISKLFA